MSKANRGANGSNGHHWIRDEKRARIYERDGYRCVWCGVNVTAGPGASATLDHVIGRDAGGTNEANNLVTCCVSCNSRRKDLDWLTWVSQPQFSASALWRLVNALTSPLPPAPARPKRLRPAESLGNGEPTRAVDGG